MNGGGQNEKRHRIRRFDASEVQGEGAWAECALLTWGQMKESKATELSALDRISELLVENVCAWNWVDDEGEPLPQPKDAPEVLDALVDEEVAFLSKCMRGAQDTEIKNS